MADSIYPNRIAEAAAAREAHQAKPTIPPMPKLDIGKMPEHCRTPLDRLAWMRQARHDWTDIHIKNGFRR